MNEHFTRVNATFSSRIDRFETNIERDISEMKIQLSATLEDLKERFRVLETSVSVNMKNLTEKVDNFEEAHILKAYTDEKTNGVHQELSEKLTTEVSRIDEMINHMNKVHLNKPGLIGKDEKYSNLFDYVEHHRKELAEQIQINSDEFEGYKLRIDKTQKAMRDRQNTLVDMAEKNEKLLHKSLEIIKESEDRITR